MHTGRAGGGSNEDASTEPLRRQGTFGKQWRSCEVLKGLKGRLELVLLACLLPTDYLLSGAHPAYVLFTSENFTTLKTVPWLKVMCVLTALVLVGSGFIHGGYPNG